MKALLPLVARYAAGAIALLLPLAAPAQPLFTKPAASDLLMGGHNIANAGTVSASSVSASSLSGALPWSNLTGLPTTLAGYGIADPVVLASGSYSDPAWIAALGWSKLTGTPATLAGYGITDLTPAKITAGPGVSYIFVGDSITSGEYLSSPATQCFQAVFATLPFCNGATTRNVGVPGWTIANITSDYATHVQPHRPSAHGGDGGARAYLVLMIGINDAFTGRTGAQMISDVTAYVTRAQADGFTVVLATLLATSNDPAAHVAQQAYNEAIRSGLVPCDLLWDANSVLTDPANAAVFSDGIHPTAAAHSRLASSLQGALMTQGGSAGAPALYNSDVVSVGGLNIGGNGAFGGSQVTLGAGGAGGNGLALFSSSAPVSGYANLGAFAGDLYLDANAGGRVALGALDGERVLVALALAADDGANKLQVGGAARFAGNVLIQGTLACASGYQTGSTGIFVGTAAALAAGHSNVIDDGAGNIYIEPASSSNTLYLGKLNPGHVYVGTGGLNVTGTITGNGAGLTGIPLSALAQSAATPNQVPVWNGSAWAPGTVGGGGGAGTVTNVAVASVPSWLTSSVANPTTTPAITIGTATNITANYVLAAPNGATGALAPRALAAADIPTLNQNTTGTAANLSGTPALPNGTTATTQSASDNSTKLATTAFVNGNGVPIRTIHTQTFTSSGTYTPTAGMVYALVHVQAAGGGGGGSTGATGTGSGGSGGGGGGSADSVFSAATIGSSQTVTIGAGGAGGAAPGNNGSTGGSSLFGSLLTATGGAGGNGSGVSNGTATAGPGGVGGIGSGGWNHTGNAGIAGMILGGQSLSGSGGGSTTGGGATAIWNANSVGNAAVANSGGGGSGGCSLGVSEAGGAGGSGVVTVTEYCTQ